MLCAFVFDVYWNGPRKREDQHERCSISREDPSPTRPTDFGFAPGFLLGQANPGSAPKKKVVPKKKREEASTTSTSRPSEWKYGQESLEEFVSRASSARFQGALFSMECRLADGTRVQPKTYPPGYVDPASRRCLLIGDSIESSHVVGIWDEEIVPAVDCIRSWALFKRGLFVKLDVRKKVEVNGRHFELWYDAAPNPKLSGEIDLQRNNFIERVTGEECHSPHCFLLERASPYTTPESRNPSDYHDLLRGYQGDVEDMHGVMAHVASLVGNKI